MNKGMKIGLIVGSVLIASLIIIPLVFGLSAGWETCQYEMEEHGMMGPWMMTGFGGWWTMGIFWLVVIGLIVWLVVYLVRNSGTTTKSSTGGDLKAIDILKNRYARGEIDKKEYEEKLKDLQ
ncbi:SHOCT domain-containing protein [Chloroflexota bacterium]